MNKIKILTIFVTICIFLYFFFNVFKLSIILDNDFGWHLKTGEYIKINGIPQNDPFSYTMPSFPFINHAWLTSLMIYELYNLESKLLLPLLFTFFAFLSVFLIVFPFLKQKSQVPKFFILSLAIICLASFAPYIGIRSQVVSWLMFSILFVILFNKNLFEKYKIAIPFLILIWVNIHGSFVAGILILALVLIIKNAKKKSVNKLDIFVLLGSLLVTFINPYRERIWGEVWMQLSDSKMGSRIIEWLPSFYFFNLPFLVILVLSTLLIFKYKNKITLEENIIYILLTIQAISATRHVPIFVIFALYVTLKCLNLFVNEVKVIKHAIPRFKKASFYFSVIIMLIFAFENFVWISWLSKYSVSKFYPQDAVTYLKENPPQGNIFSEYGWGGYLIWKYPEKKVFIDGRMPAWKWDKAPNQELSYAMNTYMQILGNKINYQEIFERFNIEIVLLPKIFQKENITFLDSLSKKIKNFFEKYKLISKTDNNFLEKLKIDNWNIVYEDETSLIFKKPE